MKNLTQSQELLIKNITDEFTRINTPIKSGGALINVNSIINNIKAEENAQKEHEANVLVWVKVQEAEIDKVILLLKEDLDLLGLTVFKRTNNQGGKFIEIKNGGSGRLVIHASHVGSKMNDYGYKQFTHIELSFYENHIHRAKSIEELIENSDLQKCIEELYRSDNLKS
jgi:hypothetical protein